MRTCELREVLALDRLPGKLLLTSLRGVAAFGRLPAGLSKTCVAFRCVTPDEVWAVKSSS